MLKPMDAKQLACRCRELADHKKAENITILDLRGLTSVTDYFVICTGSSEPHLRAIVEEIRETLREERGLRPRAVDGEMRTSWIVLDYLDVMIHVMKAELRDRYDLEGLWGDAPRVRARRARAGSATKPPVT